MGTCILFVNHKLQDKVWTGITSVSMQEQRNYLTAKTTKGRKYYNDNDKAVFKTHICIKDFKSGGFLVGHKC